MSRTAKALFLASALGLSACTSPGGAGSADCAAAVRFEGVVYVQSGFSKRAGERLGQGDEASCDDIGQGAQGTYFVDDPVQVSVWSVADLDPGQVVAVREAQRRLRVFIAEDLTSSARREIKSALRSTRR